jgi:hypothetical protein
MGLKWYESTAYDLLISRLAFLFYFKGLWPHSEINHPTAAKTVIPECGALLKILLHLVTFRYTCDRGMWRCGITVIAHEALFCKPG